MALRNIQKGEENPRLRKTSKPVNDITPRIVQLVADMKETLAEEEGVGLAAPQVGVLKRVIIIDPDGGEGDGAFEIINPVISNPKGSQIGVEGCLSLMPKSGYVERPQSLTVTGTNLAGEDLKIEAEDIESNRGSKDVRIGVNVPWDWEPAPSPTTTTEPLSTPTPIHTPSPSPTPTELPVTPTPTP